MLIFFILNGSRVVRFQLTSARVHNVNVNKQTPRRVTSKYCELFKLKLFSSYVSVYSRESESRLPRRTQHFLSICFVVTTPSNAFFKMISAPNFSLLCRRRRLKSVRSQLFINHSSNLLTEFRYPSSHATIRNFLFVDDVFVAAICRRLSLS